MSLGRYFSSRSGGARDYWAAVMMAIGAGAIVGAVVWGGGSVDIRVVYDTATATATAVPTASATAAPPGTAEREASPEGSVGQRGVVEVFPPVEMLIRHYFGPLGAVDVALRVYECESGEGGSWVGAAGELGPFQLSPRGVGAPLIAQGWNLMDPRENVIAAALIVAEQGWWPWKACLP